MLIEKQDNGSYLCTTIIKNQLVKQIYYFYTKKEAEKRFKKYIWEIKQK